MRKKTEKVKERMQRREQRKKEREKRRRQRIKARELRRQQRGGRWRIELRRNLRAAVAVALILTLTGSLYSTYVAFKQPLTDEEEVVACRYWHSGEFEYVVYLRNNTVYGNATVLHPGQGLIFKRLTDHINGSFSYGFNCDSPVNLSGSYMVVAVIQTDIWEKEFVVVPETFFTGSSRRVGFNVSFPINVFYFEDVVEVINGETGVNAGNPTLIVKCIVNVLGETDVGDFNDVFSPHLSVSLGGSIVEVNGDLHQSKPGSVKKTEMVFQQSVVEQRNNLVLLTIIVFLVLVMFPVFTKNAAVEDKKMEKMLRWIRKKYGDWVVETEKPPGFSEATVVVLKSFEDLVKTSEELGKPIIHYMSEDAEEHVFCVVDNNVQYKYTLVNNVIR